MSKEVIERDIRLVENKSLYYFLPMLGEYIYEFLNLKGVFVWNEDYPDYDNHIFLLFKKSIHVKFTENLNRLKSFSNYLSEYQPDKFHTMLIFSIHKRLIEDYELLKEGQYSKISEQYKRQIVKFHNIKNNSSNVNLRNIYNVLYCREEYRLELEDKYNVEIPPGQELASLLRKDEFIYRGQSLSGEMYKKEMKKLTNIDNETLIP